MNWRKKRLNEFKLYAITDLKEADSKIVDKIIRALQGGVDVIQLRSKTLSDQALIRLGQKIRVITRKLKRLFIMNDRVDLMQVVGADGVHLGQDDLPISVVRRLIHGSGAIIGKSTHSMKQALAAEREGADYIGFGPIFNTPTKPTYQPIGLNQIRQVLNRIRIPVVCIGGIDKSNVESVIQSGGSRIAVVRAVFSTPDSYQAAVELKRELTSCHPRML